jgi:hypothetical protein
MSEQKAQSMLPPEPARDPGMKRLLLEVALVVGVLVLGLEAVHYRNAVLECNIDRKRAWNTVVDLREKNEELEKGAYSAPASGK